LNQINIKTRLHLGLRSKPKIGIIDSSSVDNFNVSDINGYDGHKKKDGIKRFVVTDELGLLISIKCTPANVAEVNGARLFINKEFKKFNWGIKEIIADKGFVSRSLQERFGDYDIDFKAMLKIGQIKNKSEHPIALNIHSKRKSIAHYINEKISQTRWIVERTFAWMTNKRRLTKNYEKTTASAEAMVKLFGIRLALGKLV
jgi:transposase